VSGMIQLSKLVRVPLREVWKHEALNFTQWLALPENIQQLGEVIGVEFIDTQSEVGVGQFYVDILARDENDRKVVIENQLEPTNHDHLGKIITYAAGLQADIVVWIVERAREEHEQAINWLNENTTEHANFFLLQIEAWKIGDSAPAPRFNIIAKPNDWAKHVKAATAAGAMTERSKLYWDFFEQFRARVVTEHPDWTSRKSSTPETLYNLKTGTSGAPLSGWLCRRKSRCSGALQTYRPDGQPGPVQRAAHQEGSVRTGAGRGG
jgi:hypothetical protein